MKPIDAAKICTCRDRDCPNHPVNHDQGCTPCILKNLARREIPSCFFNLAGARQGWTPSILKISPGGFWAKTQNSAAIFTKRFANP